MHNRNTISKRTAAAALTPLLTYEDTATHSNIRYPYIQYLTGDRGQAVPIQLKAESIAANNQIYSPHVTRRERVGLTGPTMPTSTEQLHSEELIPTFPF